MKSYGIAYTESKHLPTWIRVSGIYKRNDPEEVLIQKKQRCLMPPRNLQIRDGKVHTCDRGVAIYSMGVADYPTDYFDLHMDKPLCKKRKLFREFVDRPFYYTCDHCGAEEGIQEAPSAIQGRFDVFDKFASISREENME